MSITKPVPSVSNEKLQWIFNFSYYYKILDLLTHSNLLLNCINQPTLFTILFYYSFFIFPLFFNVQYQRLSPSPTFSSPQSTNFKVEFFLSSQNFLKINIPPRLENQLFENGLNRVHGSGETFLRPIGRDNWYREIRAPLIEYYANTP